MAPQPQSSPLIAGSVLPIKRAEELLATLPGILAARIIANENGTVDEIHVLTSAELSPKQTVRNIESALIAHLGMRVDHRKISVATSLPAPAGPAEVPAQRVGAAPTAVPGAGVGGGGKGGAAASVSGVASAGPAGIAPQVGGLRGLAAETEIGRRLVLFEDVEVSRSRAKGLTCRVTIGKGDQSFVGEADGSETERSRIELAARAAIRAIGESEPGLRPLDLGGARIVEAFDREFVFVAVTVQHARESATLTGTAEVRDSAETASVLAVLDATNRWLTRP
ncbi:MAG: hypothetical protein ACT4OZ_02960 [Gemmatimonadota bacterium]